MQKKKKIVEIHCETISLINCTNSCSYLLLLLLQLLFYCTFSAFGLANAKLAATCGICGCQPTQTPPAVAQIAKRRDNIFEMAKALTNLTRIFVAFFARFFIYVFCWQHLQDASHVAAPNILPQQAAAATEPALNVEAVILQNQVYTLQWQLKQVSEQNKRLKTQTSH